jgi:hypothetical protein
MKQRSCDGRGARSAPFGMLNEPKKTGARSARARTRGQNPLVYSEGNVFVKKLILKKGKPNITWEEPVFSVSVLRKRDAFSKTFFSFIFCGIFSVGENIILYFTFV